MFRSPRLCLVCVIACAGSSSVAPEASAHGGAPARVASETLLESERSLLGDAHARAHQGLRVATRREKARFKRLSTASQRRARKREGRRVRAVISANEEQTPTELATTGRWQAPKAVPGVAVHMIQLPTGKVLYFGRAEQNRANVFVWDPQGDAPPVRTTVPDDINIWCGAQSLLPDGRVLVTGGNRTSPTTGYAGENTAFTFDPETLEWTREGDMRHGRWYPTQTLLGDGRTLVLTGYDEHGVPAEGEKEKKNPDIELFTPGLPGKGSFDLLGSLYTEATPDGPPQGTLYPHLFLMPSGDVLAAGPEKYDSWAIDAPGADNRFGWSDRPDWARTRYYGPSILLPDGPAGSDKVLQIGGYADGWGGSELGATATSELYDESTRRAPQADTSMNVPRAHHNAVILPDRSVAAIGGGHGTDGDNDLWVADAEHRRMELRDPVTGKWTLGPEQVFKRAYHSTAMLLPDGRVLSAGDEKQGAWADYENDHFEIYEPPYLFRGARPKIERAPDAVAWDQGFSVTTDATQAVLVAPGAVTHANDMSQRLIPLAGERRDGRLVLKAPPTPNVAPPGWYMLFALSDDGVPSVARWVHLRGDAPATPPEPEPEPDPVPTPTPDAAPAPAPAPKVDSAPASDQPATPATPGGGPRPDTGSAPTTPPANGPTTQPPATRPPASPTAFTLRGHAISTVADVRRSGRLKLRITLSAPGEVRTDTALRAGSSRYALRAGSVLRFARPGTRTVTLRLARPASTLSRGARLQIRLAARSADGRTRRTTVAVPVR